MCAINKFPKSSVARGTQMQTYGQSTVAAQLVRGALASEQLTRRALAGGLAWATHQCATGPEIMNAGQDKKGT